MPPHPRRIQDVTAPWLTIALRTGGVLQQAAVTGFTLKAIGAGVGFLSGVAQIKLTYDRAEPVAPASVVIKLPAPPEGNRQLGDSFNAYEREAHFYQEIAPRSRIRAPRCYFSVLDVAAGDFVLLFEDGCNLTPGDQVKGLTTEQVMAAIHTIGPFHAQWWDSPELARFTWMPVENIDLAHLFTQHWPTVREAYGRMLTGTELAVGDRLNAEGAKLIGLSSRAPRTIVHWDYRADNLLFDDLSKPDPVMVLDWQLAERGMGAFDIARLVGGSLPIVQQLHHHRAFVRAWHDCLLAGGVRGYSFDDAWRDYRTAILMNLYNPVAFHHVGSVQGGRGADLIRAMMRRFFHAAVECDAVSLLD